MSWMAATLLMVGLGAGPEATLRGAVLDSTGTPIAGARVQLAGPGSPIPVTDTDAAGRFVFERLPPGAYVVSAQRPGFLAARRSVAVDEGSAASVRLVLSLDGFRDDVTVTAERGGHRERFESADFITVLREDDLRPLSHLLMPVALGAAPGVHVQQTSTSQASVFLRGLTGQQVVTFVNGVRFNNSTFRPGANQYAALLDPSSAERIETAHGPGSAQYGSDALGGTVQFLTAAPLLSKAGFDVRGEVTAALSSADLGRGVSGRMAGGGGVIGFAAGFRLREVEDLRAGGGRDSHSVATRLLGLPGDALGPRLEQTGYGQRDARLRLTYRPTSDHAVDAEYLRGDQRGASRYDQLDGGLGNLLHRFDPQTLDLAWARYTGLGLGALDSVAATLSYNGQRDDRAFQNVNTPERLLSKVTDERNHTEAFGYQLQASAGAGVRGRMTFGLELYDERVASSRVERSFDAASADFTKSTPVRARFPDGARYLNAGIYTHQTWSLARRFILSGGVRYNGFRYRQSADASLGADAGVSSPDFETWLRHTSFDAAVTFAASDRLRLSAKVGHGFRAPNVNDYGSIGLSGLGFEVSPDEARRLSGVAGRLDGSRPPGAQPLHGLGPERLLAYEVGLKHRTRRVQVELALHTSELEGMIERVSLLLPPGATGQTLGGQTVVRQDPSGAVYTPLSSRPVFVRANGGRVRFWGAQTSIAAHLGADLSLALDGFAIRAADAETGAPPPLENGLPPAMGSVRLRWGRPAGRWWLEASSSLADAQRRLSANDLLQPRIGATRTAREISDFFAGGATVRGLVRDGVLVATGETLGALSARLLGPRLAPTALYTEHPGYVALGFRGGVAVSDRWTMTLALENLLDRNYRTMGSGIDAPGFSAVALVSVRFGSLSSPHATPP